MIGAVTKTRSRNRRELCAAAGALTLALLLGALSPTSVAAQALDELQASANISPNAQMLLEADELIYDNDGQTIAAVGAVRIDYDNNQLVARKVTYNQRTGRLFAEGNVEIVQPDGTRIYADKVDITDDFKDGFVNALRVETTDNTRFAAESAERTAGKVTTFNQGVYTACEPCKDNPDKPPLWQIKAKRIIWNGEKKTVRFERARLEFFGYPLAFFPVFEIPDPTVKRKTGFLIPGASYKSALGLGVKIPFYLALSPHYDLTLNGTGYHKQGFLTEAEWRQKFDTGDYSIKVAGIRQLNPEEFNLGTVDRAAETRWMVGSKGRFQINPRWVFGWDLLAQSDKNFSYMYGLSDYSTYLQRNDIYLTGLSGRNYFDLHLMKFSLQEQTASATGSSDPRQPWVLPLLDYSWYAPNPVLGGELSFTLNGQGIRRYQRDFLTASNSLPGVEGASGRFTGELEWKRTFIAPGGLAVTPLLALRQDATFVDLEGNSAFLDTATISRTEAYRTMATAGVELRWPILFSSTSATHILEPMAQFFVRNNERFAGQLPNEDAQSMVFDATTLFERDKFSGFDRMEGGTRVNLGLRYSGSFNNGWSAHALFGQSYHLGGINPFASADVVNAGAFSGLESDVSDYVAMLGASNNRGLTFAARGRFDEESFEMRRGELEVSFAGTPVSVSGRYTFIQAQPLYGFPDDRHEIGGTASAKLETNWRVFGSATYDIVSKTLVKDSIGFAYDDECFSYSLTGTETRSSTNPDAEPKRSIGFFVSLRTIGDFGTNRTIEQF